MAKYYTVKQAAEKLGLSRQALMMRMRRGQGPKAFKPGGFGHWKIRAGELRLYEKQGLNCIC